MLAYFTYCLLTFTVHSIKLQQFEGPLDLLLQLVEDKKLEITNVSLAAVTEQYLQVLHRSAQRQIPAHELADFLVIAARLLLIKSRALLPFLEWEEDEEEDLSAQLKIYKEYLEASKVIQLMIGKKRFAFSREKLLTLESVGFQPPPNVIPSRLGSLFAQIISALASTLSMPTDMVRKTISIQEKIQQIRERIYRQASSKFSDILREAKDKTEVIVSFLALLELIKQRTIAVRQENIFEDIVIEKI